MHQWTITCCMHASYVYALRLPPQWLGLFVMKLNVLRTGPIQTPQSVLRGVERSPSDISVKIPSALPSIPLQPIRLQFRIQIRTDWAKAYRKARKSHRKCSSQRQTQSGKCPSASRSFDRQCYNPRLGPMVLLAVDRWLRPMCLQ